MPKRYKPKFRPEDNKGGRPLKIATPTEFDRLVDEYVAKSRTEEQPITWTGMALALGFYGRDELHEYSYHEGFSAPVKRAKAIVEAEYERKLTGSNAAGPIFALKNMKWTDRQDINMDVNMELSRKSDAELLAEFLSLTASAGK